MSKKLAERMLLNQLKILSNAVDEYDPEFSEKKHIRKSLNLLFK